MTKMSVLVDISLSKCVSIHCTFTLLTNAFFTDKISNENFSNLLRNQLRHPQQSTGNFSPGSAGEIALPVQQVRHQPQEVSLESVHTKQVAASIAPVHQLIHGPILPQPTAGGVVNAHRLTLPGSNSSAMGDQSASPTLILPVFVPALPALSMNLSPVNTFAHHLRTKPGSPQSKTCNLNPKATHELRTKMYSNTAGFGSKTILVECKANIERLKAQALANANY